ncbi:DUF6087 family protein [Streptomyces sp. FXJ1.172]|uniref:DUF6087 family protein n=1 Tax=Streptomyces sp. FXJ1.172 TaxID=710705 RepID=UPI0023DD3DAD|nr:DUF6087 family protein [Streptomyces sp. FXJ1.172]WEO92940.1 DUF6087 family protein [Streptomyces sp. FXJ1.172]
MSDDDKALRLALADRLAAGGQLRTAPWRAAVEEVPRHEFLSGGFFEPVPGSAPTAWRPVMPDDPRWLERCYDDESLVTQIADTIAPRDIRGEILRAPTSSRTLPSLVVRMLEELQVQDGHRVLEIGSGYSTGLLCHRLGDDRVTSVEVDADVAGTARVALGNCDYCPQVIVGDGLAGCPDGAPYDRLVATCGVVALPHAWVEQTRPGGTILATLSGWLYASELARLTVGEDGTARGRFLGGQVSFMLARPQLPPPLGTLPDLNAGQERPATLAPDVLNDWNTRFVAQLAAPRPSASPSRGMAGRHMYSWTSKRRHGPRSRRTATPGQSVRADPIASGTPLKTRWHGGAPTARRPWRSSRSSSHPRDRPRRGLRSDPENEGGRAMGEPGDEPLSEWADRRAARLRPVGERRAVTLGTGPQRAAHLDRDTPRMIMEWDGYQWVPVTTVDNYAAAQRMLHGISDEAAQITVTAGDGRPPMAPGRGRHRKP